jgi:hypothetical protein
VNRSRLSIVTICEQNPVGQSSEGAAMDILIAEGTRIEWTTTNTLTVIFGVVGWVFFGIDRLRHRAESRNKALTEILEPFIECLQNLNDANSARLARERLLHSYHNPQEVPQAQATIAKKLEEYNARIAQSSVSFKRVEQCFASRLFLFPARLRDLLGKARESLSETGKKVNLGMFDQAELGVAKTLDYHREIIRYAAGVRWQAYFGWVRRLSEKRFVKRTPTPQERFALSDKEMQEVIDLVYKRVTTQASHTFVVHAPQKLLDNPAISQADDVIDQLENEIFEVVFQDGTAAMLSLPALMVFTYHLIMLKHAVGEIIATAQGPVTGTVTSKFSVDYDIMRPEMVKSLLSKIEFAESASDP